MASYYRPRKEEMAAAISMVAAMSGSCVAPTARAGESDALHFDISFDARVHHHITLLAHVNTYPMS